jgi:hypothetical protein
MVPAFPAVLPVSFGIRASTITTGWSCQEAVISAFSAIPLVVPCVYTRKLVQRVRAEFFVSRRTVALAGFAVGARRAGIPACPAVPGVVTEVHAGIPAPGGPVRAAGTGAVRADLCVCTGVPAGPAVLPVARDINTVPFARSRGKGAELADAVLAACVGTTGVPAAAAVARVGLQVDADAITIGVAKVTVPLITFAILADISLRTAVAARSTVISARVPHAGTGTADLVCITGCAALPAVLPVSREVDAGIMAGIEPGP